VSRKMTLKDSERKLLHELLQEVKPYIVEVLSIEELIDKNMESAGSVPEFAAQLRSESESAKDSILRTDLMIYLARLRKRA